MPGLLSAAELASIRADATATLDTPCTIQRKSRTSDGMGQGSDVYSTIATCNCGLSQPSAAQLATYASEIGSLAAWRVRLPDGQDVQRQDHLIVSGNTMEVQVTFSPNSYSSLLTCLASEVR